MHDSLDTVDWNLPGMEKFSEHTKDWLTRLIKEDQLVNQLASLGWSFWPTRNIGFFDERSLRNLADFIEIQNKPFWDGYEEYCKQSLESEEEETLFKIQFN